MDLVVFTGQWMVEKQAVYSGYWTMELMYDHVIIERVVRHYILPSNYIFCRTVHSFLDTNISPGWNEGF